MHSTVQAGTVASTAAVSTCCCANAPIELTTACRWCAPVVCVVLLVKSKRVQMCVLHMSSTVVFQTSCYAVLLVRMRRTCASRAAQHSTAQQGLPTALQIALRLWPASASRPVLRPDAATRRPCAAPGMISESYATRAQLEFFMFVTSTLIACSPTAAAAAPQKAHQLGVLPCLCAAGCTAQSAPWDLHSTIEQIESQHDGC